MAKNKIERIDQEITQVREKIAEYQDCLLYTSSSVLV